MQGDPNYSLGSTEIDIASASGVDFQSSLVDSEELHVGSINREIVSQSIFH